MGQRVTFVVAIFRKNALRSEDLFLTPVLLKILGKLLEATNITYIKARECVRLPLYKNNYLYSNKYKFERC